MTTFKEHLSSLNEAKPKRAWSGKLKQIDSLLSWMYDKDILNKGEKSKKDSLFRKYYRFYNDGDIPRGQVYKGKSKDVIQELLEIEIEEFIKKIISKYTGKIDRKGFRLDKQLSELQTVLGVVKSNDVHGLTKYWKKSVKDQEVLDMISTLETDYDELKAEINTFIDGIDFENDYGIKSFQAPRASHTITYQIDKLRELNIQIPKSIEDGWREIQVSMLDIEELVKNIISSIEKLKKIHNM